MKNELKLLSTLIGLLFFCYSCENSDDRQNSERIGLEIQQENLFSGKTVINDHSLSYSVLSEEELSYVATLQIDDFTLEAKVKYDDETIDFDANKVVLSISQKEALLALGEEISGYLFYDKSTSDFTMAEYTLLRLLEYWAKSPHGYTYQKMKVKPKSQKSRLKSRNEGITCIRKNTVVNADYDDDRGNISEPILVNGERCIGRCGSGCGSVFTIASAWTKDCLDHDRCGRVNGGNANSNPFDRECGDEYFEAADDYLFGVIRGCSG